MLLRQADRFLNRGLTGVRVGEDVAFDEQPFRVLDPGFIHMPRGEVARHPETGAHRALGVRGHEADGRAGELVDDDRVADLDAELLELLRVEQAIAVITDAADERGLAAELREGDDGIGDRAAAGEPRLVLLIAVEQASAAPEIDEHHAAALEPKRCELRIGDFHEDVDDGVTESAELEWFHG